MYGDIPRRVNDFVVASALCGCILTDRRGRGGRGPFVLGMRAATVACRPVAFRGTARAGRNRQGRGTMSWTSDSGSPIRNGAMDR